MTGRTGTNDRQAGAAPRGAPQDAERFFSPDYGVARERFRAACLAAGAQLHVLPLDARGPSGESLTIDIAWLGEASAANVLLHSSGLHGVEAFAGSAVQLACLAQPLALPQHAAMVLVHVLNPWGMAWLRRVNENNVDLNRNFLAERDPRTGAHEIYRRLDTLLNPPSPPAFDWFYPRALWQALRLGFGPLKQAVAHGQYEFPRGLFFGGHRLEQGPRLYLDWLARHLARARYVLALDVHTGLGRSGDETLLLEPGSATHPAVLGEALGRRLALPGHDADAAYAIRGGMGGMVARTLPEAAVDFLVQELGTYPPLVVFHALREENRWHHHGDSGLDHPVKLRLREALCPAARRWRARVVHRGLQRMSTALAWISERARQMRHGV